MPISEHQSQHTTRLTDKSHSKTQITIIPFSILLQILVSPAKKIGKKGGFSLKIGENRNRLKK